MKLSVIIPFIDQRDMLEQTIKLARDNAVSDIEIIAVDNTVLNQGNYPIFKLGLKICDADILCFIHSDVFIYEKGWDQRVIDEFYNNPELGLIGFVGSSEIDDNGGRGLGTVSNMQGRTVQMTRPLTKEELNQPDKYPGIARLFSWAGSASEAHGGNITGRMNAAVVDGCVMIFRRHVLEELPYKDYPIHHFYDRLMSCQVIERDYKVEVLGVEFDHISGQTVNTMPESYVATTKKWFDDKGLSTFEKIAREYTIDKPTNWDEANYLVAEKMFLDEYKEDKHFIPIHVK